MQEWIILAMGLLAGFTIGWFYGKHKKIGPEDLSQIGLLTNQLTEMKTKFFELEKSREKIDQEKEKRTKEWMEGTTKLFKELNDKSNKTDEEKEKRMKEYMEGTKKFFEEQKKSTEKFLEEQGKSRTDIEKARDAQLKDMQNMITKFTRAVTGTSRRGKAGEDILNEVLKNSIKAGVVKKDLKTDSGHVEFAWNLNDGKFIPIDCKMPEILELVESYNNSEDTDEQKGIAKKITDKVKKEVKTVQKYQNLSNTIDSCILVVPNAILEISPELVSIGKEGNVFVCSYQDVFPIAHVLEEQYVRTKEEGDIGIYKKMVKTLFQILDKIRVKTDSIDKAVTTIKNANESVKDEIVKGKRQELTAEED